MLLHFGSNPLVIVSSTESASEILKNHDLVFSSRPKLSVSEKLLYNLKSVAAAPYGEYWRKIRSICVLQLRSNKRVQSFRVMREEEAAFLMEKIQQISSSSLPVNLSEMFSSPAKRCDMQGSLWEEISKALEFIPFGADRRGCPGMSFAMAIVELTLANLLKNFEWSLPGGAKGEDLDLAESIGIATRRNNLITVAKPISL
ncbi:hypothetical protein GH714_043351 [Hevea brasiliensis]|uniref:Cytochrome P450 n=1 Tax=Hevea brasiliensis TaxID=3981 RepID=A0A6A6K2K4_HEVBR|nr:hypothetical protein GH714_043351 [Hevea brasiliensis]